MNMNSPDLLLLIAAAMLSVPLWVVVQFLGDVLRALGESSS